VSGKTLEGVAPIPADMQTLLDVLKRDQKQAEANSPAAKSRSKRR
jgi:hypothetical protein